ncbi:MAG: FAD/NAD(P)-binding protein [Deltaproteobacteria bacterium]|nr:FAD/NAD(P)-binding protein [Deltaproteobacteria bacterium]
MANPWIPRPVAIAARTRETADTFTLRFELEPSAGAFAPGQFNMLYAFGAGEVPISISGDPERPEVLLHTIRAVGTVTRAIARLEAGTSLGIRGPYGTAWPVDRAAGGDVLVVAGGLGLAPLRPVVYHLLAHRARFGRVAILYGARSPEDRLFARELEAWRARGDLDVAVTVDHAGRDWAGPVGVVPALLDDLAIDPAATVAMLCGPEVMMRFSARALTDRGVAPDRVFVSLERNMKCALGMCGHCQYRETFVCKDGPIVPLLRIASIFDVREI